MKKTMKKWTSFLVAMALVLAMLTTAMADTIYITDGFTIPSERIGGNRFATKETISDEHAEASPDISEEDEIAEPDNLEDSEPDKQAALDEQNIEGLVSVDGEKQKEAENNTEQTEVWMEMVSYNSVEGDIGETTSDESEPVTELEENTKDDEKEINDKLEETDNNEVPVPIENHEVGGNEIVDGYDEELVGVENEPETVTYERDENGQLVLDKRGNPIPIVPDGLEIPVKFQKDENGQLILDENGEPMVVETVAPGSLTFAELDDALDPNRSVTMYINYGSKGYVTVGDEVELIAILYGYEKAIYTLQWQCSKDNENWIDIEGETAQTMMVTVTDENIANWWRVAVIITDVVE